jgi:cellulose synthase/poly-beta-1,6-N-acetylglucosamine synthase-like glycosyltransferase
VTMDAYIVPIIIFWACVAAVLYVYAGYPVLVSLIAAVRPRSVERGTELPRVSIVITAYNEERDIATKIESTLKLDYPADKMEIIVASDCSSDRTDEIVRSFAGSSVRLCRQEQRLGKTSAQNLAAAQATGEIILFSDATTEFHPMVLRYIVRNFSDPSVGCVAGKLIYVDPADTDVGRGARSYWNYESLLKGRESTACSLIGVSGCLYAVRRSAYRPLYPEACSDFIIATDLYRYGLRTVYEPEALCTESTNRESSKEMRMRVRVISQTIADLWRNRDMLNPFRSGFFAVQLISHKVLRYAVPLFLVGAFFSSLALVTYSTFYLLAFAAQAAFYAAGILGMLLGGSGKFAKLFSIPKYFVLANAASAAGFYKFLRGERYVTWEPIRAVDEIR